MVESDKNDSTSSNTTVRELGNVLLQCPKLTKTNYTTWALMMETIMKAYGIWGTIVAKEGVTTNEKKGNTSKAIIFQTLPQDALMQVTQYTTAKEVWNSIKIKHLGADLVQKARLQTLRSELEMLRIKPNEKVSDFRGKLRSIKAKFKGLGKNLEDKILVRKLFNFAPKKFLPIVATTEQYQDLDEMSFEEAIGRLTAYEERIKSQDTLEANDQDKLLMAKQVRVKEQRTKASSGVMNVPGEDSSISIAVGMSNWTAATRLNIQSSRSYNVFTCIVESQCRMDGLNCVKTSRMILVDLARTERQEATGATGESNQNQGDPRAEWNSCRSLNILKFTLHYLMILPHINDDKDVEMKIIDEERKCCKELRGTTDGHGRPSTYSLIIHKLTGET
nr:zinc finger, CCHC-type [Tanacetum cinerariifolium]